MYKFFGLPDEVALKVYHYLPPAQLQRIKTYLDTENSPKKVEEKEVNKSLPIDKSLWREKFAYHFPQQYQLLSQKYQNRPVIFAELNWNAEFLYQDKIEYQNLPDHMPELFTLVKEGRLEVLKEKSLTLTEITQYQCINRLNLLQWALQKRHQHIVDYFYKEFIDKNKVQLESTDRTALYYAIYCRQPAEVVSSLITEDTLNVIDRWRNTPLDYAIDNSDIAVVKLLSDQGANIENTGYSTTLYRAVGSGCVDIVKIVLGKGADCNQTAVALDYTPLQWAVQKGKSEIVEILVKHGARIDEQVSQKVKPPLYLAVEKGNSAIVKFLLAQGAKIDPVPAALPIIHLAASESSAEIIEIL